MPSFRSVLRPGHRFRPVSSADVRVGSEVAEGEARLRYMTEEESRRDKRRAGSLPNASTHVRVEVLPSLHRVDTDPVMTAAILNDVIETVGDVTANHVTKDVEEEQPKSESNLNEVEMEQQQQQSKTCQELREALLRGLDETTLPSQAPVNYRLLLHDDLLDKVSQDIVRMSEHEPSGLSGCRLRTRLERPDSPAMDLCSMRIDDETEETFEIVISLRGTVHSPKRRPLGNILAHLPAIFSRHRLSEIPQVEKIHIGDAYQLEKIKHHNASDARCHFVTCF